VKSQPARIVMRRALIGLAVILVSAACAAGPRRVSDPFSGGAGSSSDRGSREVRVQVENTNFNEATIDARGIGLRRRLGRVAGTRSDEFRLSWTGTGQLYFEVDLLGGRTCITRAIEVAAGDTVRLVIDSVARLRGDGMSRLCDAQRVR